MRPIEDLLFEKMPACKSSDARADDRNDADLPWMNGWIMPNQQNLDGPGVEIYPIRDVVPGSQFAPLEGSHLERKPKDQIAAKDCNCGLCSSLIEKPGNKQDK